MSGFASPVPPAPLDPEAERRRRVSYRVAVVVCAAGWIALAAASLVRAERDGRRFQRDRAAWLETGVRPPPPEPKGGDVAIERDRAEDRTP